MTDRPITQTRDEPTDDPRTQPDAYDLPIELYAGVIIVIMGALVLVTPLLTQMPSDAPWNPTLMNLISGSIYVIVGLGLLFRSKTA